MPTPSSLASRLAATPPRTRALLVAGAGIAALLLALADDPLLATAGRASSVALALGAAALWVHRHGATAIPDAAIEVAARRQLSRDTAVVLLLVSGRSLLVGYGPDGVRILADLGSAPEPDDGART